jgi:hypothetical protein
LFSHGSSGSTGTLAQAKGFLEITNIPDKDPQKSYYACSDFLDKFCESYVIAGALHHFGMTDLESEPTANKIPFSEIDNDQEKGSAILNETLKFVEENTSFKIPDLGMHAPRSNTLKCVYCERQFKQAKSLRKHEAKEHDHPDSVYGEPVPVPQESDSSNDQVYNYTRKAMSLLLLREEHNNALHLNDGDRIMRVNKILMLLYKEAKCPKYAFGMLEISTQQEVFLPPRLAHQIRWNRTVNYQGSHDTNFPLDLDMEHDNRLFKEEIKIYRGNFTEKAIKRVSRSARLNEDILSNLDTACHVHKPKGTHKKLDTKKDVLDLVLELKRKNLFANISNRSHRGLGEIPDLFASLTADKLTEWVSQTLKNLDRKHYYAQFS